MRVFVPGFTFCFVSVRLADLAGAEDLEHERQAVCDQLLRVLVLLDAAEVLEQTLDQWAAVLDEAGAQGLEPGVQRPGNAWEHQRTHTHMHSKYTEHQRRNKCDVRGAKRADHVSITFYGVSEFEGRLHGESWISGKVGGSSGNKKRKKRKRRKQHFSKIKGRPVRGMISNNMMNSE